jgi:hypothetical protein
MPSCYASRVVAVIELQGLAPYLPPHRPFSEARWWRATGRAHGASVVLEELAEDRTLPVVRGLCGLAAPCSLPAAFLASLDAGAARGEALGALAGWTTARLLQKARAFASRGTRGRKHPRRADAESHSALDRRRLALFHAALPLLRTVRVAPWDALEPPCLFEVDAPALLRALDLPHAQLSGETAMAIVKRASILDALQGGAAGLRLESVTRDCAVAALPALRAVLALFAAAWVERTRPTPPPAGAEAWLPLP